MLGWGEDDARPLSPAPRRSMCGSPWGGRQVKGSDFSLAVTIWHRVSVHNLRLFGWLELALVA